MTEGLQDLKSKLLLRDARYELSVDVISGCDVASQQQRSDALRWWTAQSSAVPVRRIIVDRAPSGAPEVEVDGASRPVSIAHRAGRLLVGLADSRLGLDLEIVGLPQEPPWNVLAPGERLALQAIGDRAARHEAFLEVWTIKEAALKALGTGLRHEPASLDVQRYEEGISITKNSTPLGHRLATVGRFADGSERFVWACVVF